MVQPCSLPVSHTPSVSGEQKEASVDQPHTSLLEPSVDQPKCCFSEPSVDQPKGCFPEPIMVQPCSLPVSHTPSVSEEQKEASVGTTDSGQG